VFLGTLDILESTGGIKEKIRKQETDVGFFTGRKLLAT